MANNNNARLNSYSIAYKRERIQSYIHILQYNRRPDILSYVMAHKNHDILEYKYNIIIVYVDLSLINKKSQRLPWQEKLHLNIKQKQSAY